MNKLARIERLHSYMSRKHNDVSKHCFLRHETRETERDSLQYWIGLQIGIDMFKRE